MRDYFVIYKIIIFSILMTLIVMAFIDIDATQQNYIYSLETKLNIYEQEYNNFVLEDNLCQDIQNGIISKEE